MNIVEVTNSALASIRGIRRANESFNTAGCDLARLLCMSEGPRADGFTIRYPSSTRTVAIVSRAGHDCAWIERASVNGQDVYIVMEYAHAR